VVLRTDLNHGEKGPKEIVELAAGCGVTARVAGRGGLATPEPHAHEGEDQDEHEHQTMRLRIGRTCVYVCV